MVGHETTAGSLAFTLLELAKNPDVQQRLRDEIRTVGRDLNYDDIQRLQYLDAVVKEGYVTLPSPSPLPPPQSLTDLSQSPPTPRLSPDRARRPP